MEINADNWRDFARCKGMDTSIFFPTEASQGRWHDKAIAICGVCPARQHCQDYAVANFELGVWGGTTEYRRRVLRMPEPEFNLPLRSDEWVDPVDETEFIDPFPSGPKVDLQCHNCLRWFATIDPFAAYCGGECEFIAERYTPTRESVMA